MSVRLDPSTAGASAQVNARMTPDLLRVIDAEVKAIHKATKEPCDRSRALRAIVRAHGEGRAVDTASSVATLEHQRDEAIRERDAARAQIRTVLAARDQTIALNNRATMELIELRAENARQVDELAARDREIRDLHAEVKALRAELLAATLRTSVPSELVATPRQPVESVGVSAREPATARKPRAPRSPRAPKVSPALVHAELRTRWVALKVPLRPFVAAHGLPRTTFQRWAAGSDVVAPGMLAKIAGAIQAAERTAERTAEHQNSGNSGNRA